MNRSEKTEADVSTGLAKAAVVSSRKIWLLPALALLGWAGIALLEQPVVNRTYQLKHLISSERWREAIEALPGRRVRWALDVDPVGFA